LSFRVHRFQQLAVLVALEREVVPLERIAFDVDELDVVELEERIEVRRHVVLLRGEIPREAIAAVEHAADRAPLAEVRVQRAFLRCRLKLRLAVGLLQHGDHLLHEVAVDVGEHVVAEKRAVAHGAS